MSPRGHRLRRWAALPAVVAPLALVLAGCGSAASGTDDGRLDVQASFYPLQFVAERVGGDRVTVGSLTPPGAEPHDVELSPAQVSRIDRADVVVYLSGFQAAVDDAVAQTRPAHLVDAADVVHLLTPDEEESHEEHLHDGHADEGEHGHDHASDPHFWLDPTLLEKVVGSVATALTAADPDGAATYEANAAALTADLQALDERYQQGLAQCADRTIVTSHEAFGYLADRYGLTEVGISGLDPDAEPSPARLAAVEKLVRDQGVSTIFFETLVSPKVAHTLAEDAGVRTAVLDPVEGIADDGATYLTVADDNLAALRVALSCS